MVLLQWYLQLAPKKIDFASQEIIKLKQPYSFEHCKGDICTILSWTSCDWRCNGIKILKQRQTADTTSESSAAHWSSLENRFVWKLGEEEYFIGQGERPLH